METADWILAITGGLVLLYTVFTGVIMASTLKAHRFTDYPVATVHFKYEQNGNHFYWFVTNKSRLPLSIYPCIKALWTVAGEVKACVTLAGVYSGDKEWDVPPGNTFRGHFPMIERIWQPLGLTVEKIRDTKDGRLRIHYSWYAKTHGVKRPRVSSPLEVQWWYDGGRNNWILNVSPVESGIETPEICPTVS